MTAPEVVRIIFLAVTGIAFMWILYSFLFNWNKDELVRTERKANGEKEKKDKPKKSDEDMEVQMAKTKNVKVPVDSSEVDREIEEIMSGDVGDDPEFDEEDEVEEEHEEEIEIEAVITDDHDDEQTGDHVAVEPGMAAANNVQEDVKEALPIEQPGISSTDTSVVADMPQKKKEDDAPKFKAAERTKEEYSGRNRFSKSVIRVIGSWDTNPERKKRVLVTRPTEQSQARRASLITAARPKIEYAGRGRFNVSMRKPIDHSTHTYVESSDESGDKVLEEKTDAFSVHGVAQTIPTEHPLLIEEHSTSGVVDPKDGVKTPENINDSIKEAFMSAVHHAVKPALSKGDDLRRIIGVSSKIERALKDSGLITYKKLAKSNSGDVVDILHSHGIDLDERHTASWFEQALLASRGDWATLGRFQASLQDTEVRKHTAHSLRNTRR